jgi:hypothetical protein
VLLRCIHVQRPAQAKGVSMDVADSLHLDVNGPPPDVVLARLLVDDSLVLGTSPGLLTREVDQSAGGRDDRSLVHDGVLVQRRDGRISLGNISQPPVAWGAETRLTLMWIRSRSKPAWEKYWSSLPRNWFVSNSSWCWRLGMMGRDSRLGGLGYGKSG